MAKLFTVSSERLPTAIGNLLFAGISPSEAPTSIFSRCHNRTGSEENTTLEISSAMPQNSTYCGIGNSQGAVIVLRPSSFKLKAIKLKKRVRGAKYWHY